MKNKNYKLFTWIISLFSFSVLLSFNAYAYSKIFRNMSRVFERLLFTSVRIPHPPGYGTSEIPLILIFAIITILTVIIYRLTQWDGTKLYFLQGATKPAIAFSISLSLIIIYAVPFVEWISDLIDFSLFIGFLLAIIGIVILIYLGILKIWNKIPEIDKNEYIKSLEEKKEMIQEKKRYKHYIRMSKVKHEDPEKAIKEGLEKLELLNIDMNDIEKKNVNYIAHNLEIILGSFPVFEKSKDLEFVYNTSEAKKLIHEASKKLYNISILTEKMIGFSEEFQTIKNSRFKMKNIKTTLENKKINFEKNVIEDAEKKLDKNENLLKQIYLRIKQDLKEIYQYINIFENQPNSNNFSRVRLSLLNEINDIFKHEKLIIKMERIFYELFEKKILK